MATSKRTTFFAAAVPLLCVLGAAVYLGYVTTDQRLQAVALGVVGSLLASIVFTVLSDWTDSPQNRTIDRLEGALSRVEALRLEAEARLNAGVRSVSDKYEHNPEFWFGILQPATKLDLVGYSLSGWVDPTLGPRLKDQLRRLLTDGAKVRILLMDPDGPGAARKKELMGKDYPARIRDFVELLGELMDEFAESFEADTLGIRLAKDDLAYMMIDNGQDLHVSPYLSVTRANHPIVVTIEGASKFAVGYRADFEQMWKRASRPA